MLSISDMQLSKIPVPLLIAALVATTAVVIYLQLSVVSVPVVADPNFTTTLIAGTPYMWRGAGSEFTIASNASIKLTYMPVAHVIYINGPLGNASLGGNAWLVYLKGGRPLLVEKLVKPDGIPGFFVFKLVNATKVGGLSVLVPQKFDVSDTLSTDEFTAILEHTGVEVVWRVVNIYTNGTHLALDISDQYNTVVQGTVFYTLPPAVDTTSTKITSSGYGVSYIVNATTVSAYLMPYQHVVIVPKANARVTITAR
jgi:hypothetical protein